MLQSTLLKIMYFNGCQCYFNNSGTYTIINKTVQMGHTHVLFPLVHASGTKKNYMLNLVLISAGKLANIILAK
jgi:hypothetical protein